MKSIHKFLMIIVLAAVAGFSATAKDRVTVTQNKFVLVGDSVYVDLLIGLNNAEIPANSFVLLTPAIQMGSASIELPAVMINGKRRQKAYHRLVALRGDPSGVGLVINPDEKDAQRSYAYSATVPFEPWMEEADFAIREDQCDCNGPLMKMSFELIAGRMQDMNPAPPAVPLHFVASFKEPDTEPVKARSEAGTAYLDYALGSAAMDPNFMNNAAELAKISEMIYKIKSDPSITINRIIIDGHSSPDGSQITNATLSGKRSAALKDYLRYAYVLDEKLFAVIGHGEDWNTFEELMIASDVPYREEALSIIRSDDSFDVREKKLKELRGGAPYKDMLANFFTKLRRSDYELQYTVIPFTVEEGKKKIETNPSLLSLNEMFLIAKTYPVGSDEFQRIFDIAVKTYPDSDIANFNAAANALSAKDVDAAQKFLENVTTYDAAYRNNKGMLAAMQGNYDEAAEHFRMAVEGGNDEAAKNLAEIEKVKKPFYSVNN